MASKKPITSLTDTQIAKLTKLAVILKQIHIRLIMEGYTITEDDIIPPPKSCIESKKK